MAKIIEFYVPDRFHKLPPEVPSEDRGKILVFQPRIVVLGEMDCCKSQPAAHIRNMSESGG